MPFTLPTLAVLVVGAALAKRGADRHVLSTIVLMIAGTLMIYAIGTTWLTIDLRLGAGDAFRLGVRPFLATDSLKIVVAALAFPTAWKLARPDAR